MKFAWDYLRKERYIQYAKAAGVFSEFLAAMPRGEPNRNTVMFNDTADDWMYFSATMIDILVLANKKSSVRTTPFDARY